MGFQLALSLLLSTAEAHAFCTPATMIDRKMTICVTGCDKCDGNLTDDSCALGVGIANSL
jgi:hypothetical protein